MITSDSAELSGEQLGPLEQPETYAVTQRKAALTVIERTPRHEWRDMLDALGLLPQRPPAPDERCQSRHPGIQRRCTDTTGHNGRHRANGRRWD